MSQQRAADHPDATRDSGGESSYVTEVHETDWHVWREQPWRRRRFDIELTERCNLNCIHCYINKPAGDMEAKGREMSAGLIKSILDEAAELGKVRILFTGGEPLLRKEFAEVYQHARERGFRVLVFTNATLMTPEVADLLARMPPLERIEVSVYGMSQESYEAVTRRPGSYKAFRRGVDLLMDREVPFLVKMPVLPPNEHELEQFEEWSAEVQGGRSIRGLGVVYKKRGRRDSAERNRCVEDIRHSPDEVVSLMRRADEVYLRSMREFCSRFLGPHGDRIFACASGRSGSVDAYGRLQPCLALRHPDVVVDLTKHSLREALEDTFPKMRERRSENPSYLSRCGRCFLKSLCEQCPATSWQEHGTLDTPVEYLCQVAHAIARDLGLLKEGEVSWEVDDWKSRVEAILD